MSQHEQQQQQLAANTGGSAAGGDEPSVGKNDDEQAAERTSISAQIVHEAIRLEGVDELKRPSSALAWSALAAGLSMGFSMAAQGLLRTMLPDAPWRPLITNFGYSIGFLIVVLGRQQLFTENTLTVILPLLHERSAANAKNVARLWIVVLLGNLLGALVFAWVAADTGVFTPAVRHAFTEIGSLALRDDFGTTLLRAVFAGWLIALMVWLLPFAESGRIAVIVLLTFLIGLGGFPHVVAGAIEVMYMAISGAAPWGRCLGGYLLPALLGNVLGGVALVALVNHAQVVAGGGEDV